MASIPKASTTNKIASTARARIMEMLQKKKNIEAEIKKREEEIIVVQLTAKAADDPLFKECIEKIKIAANDGKIGVECDPSVKTYHLLFAKMGYDTLGRVDKTKPHPYDVIWGDLIYAKDWYN